MPDIGLTRDLVIIVSGLTGLGFAVYRYIKSREAEAILQLELTAEFHPIDAKTLVDVVIHVKNVGKAAAYISARKREYAICSVRRIPVSERTGGVEWEDLEEFSVIEKLHYLSDKDWTRDYPNEPFVFEPGATDQYHVVFVTDQAGPLWVRGILVDVNDYKWRADRVFSVPEPKPKADDTVRALAFNTPLYTDGRQEAPPAG